MTPVRVSENPTGRAPARPNPAPDQAVVTRSFGAALFLYSLGYPVLHIRSRDGSVFNAMFTFSPAARADYEQYYKLRDRLNAEIGRFLGSPGNTTNEDQTHDGSRCFQ